MDYKGIKEIQNGWATFYGRYHWQWFITLSFPMQVSVAKATKEIKQYLKRLKEVERLKIAGLGVINIDNPDNCHAHIGLLSENVPYAQSLLDVDLRFWERQWNYSSRGQVKKKACDIQLVVDGTHAVIGRYMSSYKNMKINDPQSSDLFVFRKKLLDDILSGDSSRQANRQASKQEIFSKAKENSISFKGIVDLVKLGGVLIGADPSTLLRPEFGTPPHLALRSGYAKAELSARQFLFKVDSLSKLNCKIQEYQAEIKYSDGEKRTHFNEYEKRILGVNPSRFVKAPAVQ